MACLLALFLCLLLTCSVPATAQEPSSTTTLPTTAQAPVTTTAPAQPPAMPRIATVPRTIEEITRLLKELDEEAAALAPTTQPVTSQPTTQPDGELDAQLDGWRLELWRAIQELRSQLLELERQTKQLEGLDEDALVAQITETIADYRKKTAEVQKLRIPFEITEEQVAEARTLYEKQNQALEVLTASLAQQEALINEGFAAQRSRIAEELRALQSRRERLESVIEAELRAADSDAAREIIQLRRRVLATRALSLETTRVNVGLRERLTQQEAQQNKLRIDALQPYVAALRQRMTSLIEERSRSRVERLRARIDTVDISEVQRAAYRLELICAEHTANLQRDFADAIRDRYTAGALATRQSMSKRDQSYWKEFSASLTRRSPIEVRSAYQDAGQALQRARTELSRLQKLLDLSLSEDRKLEDYLLRALAEYDEVATEFQSLTQDATGEEVIRLKSRIAQFRPDLRKAFEDIIKDEQDVIERLRQGIEVAEANVALWEEAVSRLYWARLITRGPTILDADAFAVISDEIRALGTSQLQTSLEVALKALESRLNVQTRLDWSLFVITSLAIIYIGQWLTRTCHRIRSEPLEEESAESIADDAAGAPTAPPRFGLRLRYHLARVGMVVVPILIVPAVIMAFILGLDITGAPARLGYLATLLLGGTALGIGVVNAAFKAPKPRYRLIACSRAVARYYRRFAYTIVFLAPLFLGAAGLLNALELAPQTAARLVTSFVFVTTLVGFIFLLRRETVLNVFPRTQRGRYTGTVAFLRTIHPFLLMLALLIMIMHVIGYSALSVYLVTGLTSTLAITLVAWLAHQLVKEFVYWIVLKARAVQAKYAPPEKADAAADGTSPATGAAAQEVPAPYDAGQTNLLHRLPPAGRAVVLVVRWLLIVAAALSALSVWGIGPNDVKRLLDLELWRHGEQPITLWRIGGAILTLLLTILASRALRQTLQSRVYPHHPTIDRGMQAAINTLLHYLTIAIGIYIGLQTLQIDFGALVVLFGGLGLGIGLGLQSLVMNFISGLLMLFERHVKVGDTVIVHDKLGEVTKVSMRSTTIRTPDGIYLVIPNGEFINQKVENWTLEGQPIRGSVDVGVSYGADPRRVKDLLEQIAFAEPMVRMDPAPAVQFVNFGDSALHFKLVCWFNNPGERWTGMLNMRYTIVEKFRENGIEIPFPQRTLSFTGNPFQVQSVQVAPSSGPMPDHPADPNAKS